MANEAFAPVKIDRRPKDADWPLSNGRSAHFDYWLDESSKADYVEFDRQGRALAHATEA